MNYMFLNHKKPTAEQLTSAQSDVNAALEDLSLYVNAHGHLSAECKTVWGPFGPTGIEADLLWDGEPIRHYTGPEQLILDVLAMELKVINGGINGR